ETHPPHLPGARHPRKRRSAGRRRDADVGARSLHNSAPSTQDYTSPNERLMDEHHIAQKLAWFSIGLGLAEVTMPGRFARGMGLQKGHRLIQAFGLREIAAGVGILTQRKRAPWLWARVAGDALDIAGLVAALTASRKRGAVAAALASVAVVAMADVVCAG